MTSEAECERTRVELGANAGREHQHSIASAAFDRQLAELQALLAQQTRRLTACATQRDDLSLRLSKLDRRLRKVKKSPSWQLTRWARLLGNSLSGIIKKTNRHPQNSAKIPPIVYPAASEVFGTFDAHAVIAGSGLFSSSWYRRQNPVDPNCADLVDHYLTAGPRASAFPCPLFDRNWYVSEYPDIAKIDLDPLAHYMTNGWREGNARPHPLFDPKSYLDINADLDKLTNPLQHFIQRGAREGRVAFSPDLFASQDASEALAPFRCRGRIDASREGKTPGRRGHLCQPAGQLFLWSDRRNSRWGSQRARGSHVTERRDRL